MNTELKVASPMNGFARRLVGSGVLEQAQALQSRWASGESES